MSNAEVDHFIPWARYPDNGMENLVLADTACNRDKRDFLAAAEHVQKWATRNRHDSESAEALRLIAQKAAWATHPGETLGAARAIYLRLADEANLWRIGKEFVGPDRQGLEDALR